MRARYQTSESNGESRTLRPRARGPSAARAAGSAKAGWLPSLTGDRDELGVGRAPLRPARWAPRGTRPGRPAVPRRASGRPRDQRAARTPRRSLCCAQLGGDGPLGQVVDALEAPPLTADQLADVEQPLRRDLDLGPVPPRRRPSWPLPARLPSGAPRRAGGPPPRRSSSRSSKRCQRLPLGPPGPAREGVGRPFLEGKDAGRVRPVLEGGAPRTPVGPLDPARPIAPWRA